MLWFLKILNKKGKEREGFTVIGTLIVVAVIALAVGLVVSSRYKTARQDRGAEGLELLDAIKTYYVLKSVEGEPPDAPVATDAGLLTWGIHVEDNKNWKGFVGSDATAANVIVFSFPDVRTVVSKIITVTITGQQNSDLKGIQLSINCITGETTENYYYKY